MLATANADHARVVQEILDELFELDTSGSVAEGGYGSEREAVEQTWRDFLSPEEMAAEFEQAVGIIEGFCTVAEDIGPVLLTLMGDAKKRVIRGRELCRRALKAPDEQSER